MGERMIRIPGKCILGLVPDQSLLYAMQRSVPADLRQTEPEHQGGACVALGACECRAALDLIPCP
jgi:hypothetical protein